MFVVLCFFTGLSIVFLRVSFFCLTVTAMTFLCFKCWFFCKQKTAYELRIIDWSSDVCSSDLLTLGPREVPANIAGEHIHRRIATQDRRIVERLEVVSLTQLCLRPRAQTCDFAVADLVTACLARPAAITVHLALHLFKLGAIALDKELLALFAGPALVVQAGVDHHSACAERKAFQIAEPPDPAFIISDTIVSQFFAQQRPDYTEN